MSTEVEMYLSATPVPSDSGTTTLKIDTDDCTCKISYNCVCFHVHGCKNVDAEAETSSEGKFGCVCEQDCACQRAGAGTESEPGPEPGTEIMSEPPKKLEFVQQSGLITIQHLRTQALVPCEESLNYEAVTQKETKQRRVKVRADKLMKNPNPR
ncbi:hypothetical protein CC80DRAFT_554214 [Byssothecium circinans]|uniref:Uncharacterized protein n=1 Tax=Byssothecium circinans TaxID=147558 RepID=A0A6A5TDT4_9PLEO|nr:hypothetical protein CC80DRAFT_554214 [Byssothecium circinans]